MNKKEKSEFKKELKKNKVVTVGMIKDYLENLGICLAGAIFCGLISFLSFRYLYLYEIGDTFVCLFGAAWLVLVGIIFCGLTFCGLSLGISGEGVEK